MHAPKDAGLHSSNFSMCNAVSLAPGSFPKLSPGQSAQVDHALPERAAEVEDMRHDGLETNASLVGLLDIDLALKRFPAAPDVKCRAVGLAEHQCEIGGTH